ncbi:MAG: RrF2 family transcriptional regulator [Hyphomicrobiales bacterium]
MISYRARYAFKALAALARAQSSRGLQIRQLAEGENIPRKFLEQILLTLKAAGLIASRRGREGGYELLKSPAQITIGQLLRIVDGPIAPLPCLSRTAYQRCKDCNDEETCAVRHAFVEAYAVYLAKLEGMTLAQALKLASAERRQVPTILDQTAAPAA